jgi:hypothetical protein
MYYNNELTLCEWFWKTAVQPGSISLSNAVINCGTPFCITGSSAAFGDFGSSYSYRWKQRPVGDTGPGEYITGATAESYCVPAGINSNMSYSREAIFDEAIVCTPWLDVITLGLPLVAGDIQFSGETYFFPPAVPEKMTVVNSSGGMCTYTYQWQQKSITDTEWIDIPQATKSSYQPAVLDHTTLFRCRVQSGTQTAYTDSVELTVIVDDCDCDDADLSSFRNLPEGYYAHPTCPRSFFHIISGMVLCSSCPPIPNLYWDQEQQMCDWVDNVLQPGYISLSTDKVSRFTPFWLQETAPPFGGDGDYNYRWKQRPFGDSGPGYYINSGSESHYSPGISTNMSYCREVSSNGKTVATPWVHVILELFAGEIQYDGATVFSSEYPFSLLPMTVVGSYSGTGTYTYQWQQRTAGTAVWTDIPQATASSYLPETLLHTTSFRCKVQSGTETAYTDELRLYIDNNCECSGTDSGNTDLPDGYYPHPGCPQLYLQVIQGFMTCPSCPSLMYYNNELTLCEWFWKTAVQPGSISLSNAATCGTPFCITGSSAAFGDFGSSYSYRWKQRPVGDTGPGEYITGATAESYCVPAGINSNMSYSREAIFDEVIVCTPWLDVITLGLPLVAGDIQYSGETYLFPPAVPDRMVVINTNGGMCTYTYQWQQKSIADTEWIDIPQATASSYQPAMLDHITLFRCRVQSGTQTAYTDWIRIEEAIGPGSLDYYNSDKNYIVSCLPTVPVPRISDLSKEEQQYSSVVQYYDGLGRPEQTVLPLHTPEGNDLISTLSYDAFGRESRRFLPVSVGNNNGAYVSSTATLSTARQNTYGMDASHAFAEARYEASPLNRVAQQLMPGANWEGHPVQIGRAHV